MNRSSLFSFEESPVWDPKIIRKLVVVPQDELIKLNSIPGWTKVQDEHNVTRRLDKDFPIENSQSIYSVNIALRNEIIEKNTLLFYEQIENRKDILKTYKVYEKKLSRSLSLFDLNRICETSLDNKTLKRALSFQSLYHSSSISNIYSNFPANIPPVAENMNAHFIAAKEMGDILPAENGAAVSNNNISDLVTQSLIAEKADLPFETPKENDGVLLAENSTIVPSKISDQLMKHVTESETVDNSEIVKEKNEMSVENTTAKPSKSSGFIEYLIDNVTADKKNLEIIKNYAESVNQLRQIESIFETLEKDISCAKASDNFVKSVIIESISDNSADKRSLNKVTESGGSVMNESDKLDTSIEIGSPAHVIPASNNVNITLSSTTQEQSLLSNSGNKNEAHSFIVKGKFSDNFPNRKMLQDKNSDLLENTKPLVAIGKHFTLDSNCFEEAVPSVSTSVRKSVSLESHQELCPSRSERLGIPAEQLPIPKFSETKNLVKNSGSDMKTKGEINDAKCDPNMFPPNNDTSFPKKRKLESRNKKSKRIKSEEKQSNVKIRSIKKVGEVCYSGEEVKTMLDIMKQFL